MGKIRRFLGLLTTLAMVFFAANSFAAGYTCDTDKEYTTCNLNYYLKDGACLDCDLKNGATTSSTVDLALGSNMIAKTATCTKTCTGATSGSNGSSQCCSYGDCSYSDYSCTCADGYTENEPDSENCSCSCTTTCKATLNDAILDSGTEECERDCSVSGGSCYYSGSTRTYSEVCVGTYTNDACASASSAEEACTGCSKSEITYGTCEGGTRYIKCPELTYWNGSSCEPCGDGVVCPGFDDYVTESSLSDGDGREQCPEDYRDGSAVTKEEDCLGAFQKSGIQDTPPLPDGWADRTLTDCQVGTCMYYKKYSGTVTQDCTPKNCTKGQTCTSAKIDYYLDSEAGICAPCDKDFPSSDGGNVTSDYCYTSCATGYSGRDYKSAPDTCKATSCGAGYYLDGGTCEKCPDGYPYSEAGSTEITQCYSDTKQRPWTGSQTECSKENATVTCEACSIEACDYVAYSNAEGTGDGEIKSGCETNNESCEQETITYSCEPKFYDESGTCEKCPDGYPYSEAGSTAKTQCYSDTKQRPWTGSQTECSKENATVTCEACSIEACDYVAYSNAEGTGDGEIKSGCATNNESCEQKTITYSCEPNFYAESGTCKPCPDGYPYSEAGSTAKTQCYSDTKQRPWTGTQTECSKDNATVTCEACSIEACDYVAYSNAEGTGDGEIKSGCATNNESCEQETITYYCKENFYDESGTCTPCPDGYPYSEAGSTEITQCYSDTKQRAMTSCTQNACSNPDPTGCVSMTCAASCDCTGTECDYVAYSNTEGTGDGDIKSGCSTNEQSCTKDVASLSAKTNFYVNGTTSCPACPTAYPLSNGGNISDKNCYHVCTPADVWDAKTVSGIVTKGGTSTCVATSCNGSQFYLDDGKCRYCPPNAVCNGGESWSCPTGYYKYNDMCYPNKYTVTLNDNGGSGGSGTVTAQYGYVLPNVKVPTRTNYNFVGYYTAASGGTQYIDSIGWGIEPYKKDGTMTLYAHWEEGVFTCESGKASDGTACSAGYWCPGGNVADGTETSTTSGCERKCPTDTTGGGTVSSPASSTSRSACYTTRPNTETPNKTGAGDQLCKYGVSGSDNYAGECNITITSCIGGYYRQAIDDAECTKTDIGYYSPDGSVELSACSALSGADDTVKTAATGSDAATDCYNTCSSDAITNGTRVPTATSVYYNGTTIPKCSYTTSCNKGYAASGEACNPKVLKITLDHNGGTSSTNTIYLKYNTGWYSNEGATTKITSVPVPTLTGKDFSGYLSGNTVVADASGVLTTDYTVFDADDTITASFESFDQNESITCPAGTYYKGTGTTCTDCPAGSYCSGVTTIQGTGEAGRKTCSALGDTYTAATDASGTKLPVSVSSATKSDEASDCYATNVAYTSGTGRASGSQTCYYNEATGAYTSSCTSVSVLTCIAGYYWVSGTDCTKVGTGYYSGEGALERSTCPGFGIGSNQVTTDSETSDSITACKMAEIWTEVSHGAQRQSCTHKSTAPSSLSDVSGYLDNCEKGVIVVCDAGYYLASDSDTACSEVGENYYSPAQSACSGEAAQPLSSAPGCSIKRTACPAGGSTDGATTSDSVEDCGVCPAGSVCIDEETFTCSELTGGEYTLSDVGTTDVSGCYKVCSETCINPCKGQNSWAGYDYCSKCPDTRYGACVYDSEGTVSGRQYYGSSSCTIEDPYCEVDTDHTTTTCPAGNYMDEDALDCSLTCKSLTSDNCPNGNCWVNSSAANLSKGEYACYTNCTPQCNYAKSDILDSNGVPTGEYVNYCPENATCTEVSSATNGYFWYPSKTCIPLQRRCSFTYVCDLGYEASTTGNVEYGYLRTTLSGYQSAVVTAKCNPITYTVTLNDNEGAGGSGTIYQKYKTGWYSNEGATSEITAVKVPTRTNYSFKGYYTAKTGGTKAIDSDGTILSGATYTATTTLYAQWEQNAYQCVAGEYYDAGTLKACVAPYYCPGEGTVKVGDTGCRSTCPQNGYTIEGGQSAVTACHKSFNEGDDAEKVFDNGTATWDCTWVGTVAAGSYASCNINIADCDAGYYNPSGTLACSEVQSGHYSPDKDLDQTACPAKSPYEVGSDGGTNSVRDRKQDCYIACTSYVPTVSNSTSVYVTSDDYSKMYYATSDYAACQYTVECKTGYTPVSGATPACNAKEYTITLDKNGGSGDVASSVQCTFDSGKCALPATSGLTRAGYNVVAKWCTAADGTGTCYGAGDTITTNISATGENTTLYAVWEPMVFEITLAATDADKNGAQGPVYLKYATGWYSDAAATKAMTSLGSALPEKGDGAYLFGGYKIGTVSIIDANGTLSTSEAALTATTTNATANVVWTAGWTKCAAGTYYPGNGSTCTPCTANHYCPAGNYQTDSGTVGGLNACPNKGLSAGGTSATDITVCYKEKMAYTTYIDVDDTLPKAKGAWTCYYDTVGYTDCQEDTVEIAWCAGGYWYNAAQTKIDCIEVGQDNYSPEAHLTKSACPDGGSTAGATTSDALSDCTKRVDTYESPTGNAKGSYVCHARMNSSTATYDHRCQTDTLEITWCAGGYWYNAAQTKIDCIEVGQDNYSPEADLTKSACPDGGSTAGATTSDSLSDCAKRVDTYESATGNAKGSYVCHARIDGSTVKYDQNCQTDTVQITWCKAGHWYDATQSKLDCVEVGLNNYGPVANASGHMIDKEACPHDGTTTTTTASTPHATCKKTVVYPGVDYDGPAVHGSGLHGCYYDSMSDGKLVGNEMSDGYLLNCDSITITKCDAGYYWAARTDTVCKVVDYGFYGPVADANNSKKPTARQACPDNGLTKTDTSADASACYLTDVACSVANGRGEHTCNYDKTDAAYSANCTKCSVTGCNDGYSQAENACINCPENTVCQDDNQQTCTVATGGTHPMSDSGTADVAYCYKDCALVANALEMSGRDYYGQNVADTCEIAACVEGYALNKGKCVPWCPEGFFCGPEGDDDPLACPSTHPASDAGASGQSDCYKVCEPYEVENGTAVPVEEHAFYPNDCEFKGVSISGNPCEFIDGVCVETACNYNFEMVNGVCKPCARENAITYKKKGNCVVESCASGYHPNGQMCEADVLNCTAPNAIVATQKWNAQKNAFDKCIITECAEGYHLAANACQIDEQVCELAHGIGVREWNYNTNTWGECIATKCDPGYTNDRSMTNELWEQCGRCNNMYSANGELAASSYVAECEIASCMYQGEKYALQNNECVLICDTYSDETGARRWDGKKCVTECEDGYMAW